MKEIKINQNKCYVDKRRLVLDFLYDGKNYVFSYDGWGDKIKKTFTIDGQKVPFFKIINDYKHCIQAYLFVDEDDALVFIDRRYIHNHSYDVYFASNHYVVEKN